MPTYEYKCEECGSVIEIFQSIKATPLRKAECETCGTRRPVKRLIGTGGAVIFKGSGFYQTDYRSESYKTAAKSETESKGDAKTEGKSDNKAGSGTPDSKKADTPAKSEKAAKPEESKSSGESTSKSAKKSK